MAAVFGHVCVLLIVCQNGGFSVVGGVIGTVNIVALVGSTVSMNCSDSNNSFTVLSQTDLDTKSSNLIFTKRNGSEPVRKCECCNVSAVEDGVISTTITEVQTKDAGIYTCTEYFPTAVATHSDNHTTKSFFQVVVIGKL